MATSFSCHSSSTEKNCSAILLWFLIIHIRINPVKCKRSEWDLMCSYDGENHSQISCWAHMVISMFEYACKCLIQHQSSEGMRKKTSQNKFSFHPLCLSSSKWWAFCTQSFRSDWSNYWNEDSCSTEESFQKVPLLLSEQSLWWCQQTRCCGISCSRSQCCSSPHQQLR